MRDWSPDLPQLTVLRSSVGSLSFGLCQIAVRRVVVTGRRCRGHRVITQLSTRVQQYIILSTYSYLVRAGLAKKRFFLILVRRFRIWQQRCFTEPAAHLRRWKKLNPIWFRWESREKPICRQVSTLKSVQKCGKIICRWYSVWPYLKAWPNERYSYHRLIRSTSSWDMDVYVCIRCPPNKVNKAFRWGSQNLRFSHQILFTKKKKKWPGFFVLTSCQDEGMSYCTFFLFSCFIF